MSDKPQCDATTKNGERCRTPALPGKTKCFTHDESAAAARLAGRRAGGKTRSKPAAVLPRDTADVELADARGVVKLLCVSINQVRCGEIDPRIGNAVAYMVTVLLRAFEVSELSDRITALEQQHAAKAAEKMGGTTP